MAILHWRIQGPANVRQNFQILGKIGQLSLLRLCKRKKHSASGDFAPIIPWPEVSVPRWTALALGALLPDPFRFALHAHSAAASASGTLYKTLTVK